MNIGVVGAKYIAAMNAGFKYIDSVGGTRSGKTYEAIQLFHLKAKQTPGLVIVIAGLTVPITKKNLIEPYHAFYGSEWSDHYNKQEAALRYPNGSIVYFMSTGESKAEEKFTGIKSNYALLDEINLSPEGEGVVRQLGMRLENGTIILTMNPSRKLQWLVDLEDNPKTLYIHSTYKDNLDNLPQDLIEDIEYQGSKDKRFKSVYLEGKYMANAEQAIFTKWDVVNTWPEEYKWRTFGADWGFRSDPNTLVEVRFANDELYVKCHVYEQGLITDDIFTKFMPVADGELIYADNSEPRLISELFSKGLQIVGDGKARIMDGIRSLQNIKINLWYEHMDLVREFEDYQFKKVSGVVTDTPEDKNNHAIDAIRYAIKDKLITNLGKYSYR